MRISRLLQPLLNIRTQMTQIEQIGTDFLWLLGGMRVPAHTHAKKFSHNERRFTLILGIACGKVAPKGRKNIGRGERSVTPANHAPSTLLAPKGRKKAKEN